MAVKLIKGIVVAGAILSGFSVAHASGEPSATVISDGGEPGASSLVSVPSSVQDLTSPTVRSPTNSIGLTRAQVRQALLESEQSGEFERIRHEYDRH